MEDNPWLQIPAAEYESHMKAVGQTAVLRELFARTYARLRPATVVVLGCTTGGDLALVDPAVTELAVGVDVNPEYVEIARTRLSTLGSRLQLLCADALQVDLPPARYDLVHAALLLEYVDPASLLHRILEWLSPGGICSLITQQPTPDVPSVSSTRHQSLQTLSERMTLRTAEEVVTLATDAGLRLISSDAVRLPAGKTLVSSLFGKGNASRRA